MYTLPGKVNPRRTMSSVWTTLILLFCMMPFSRLNAQTEPVLQVFASIPPQMFLLDQIGKDRITVRVLLQPGHSPETFDPSPRLIAGLSDADMYFCIGVPFESRWMKVISSRNARLQLVNCQPETDDGDPHTWTDPVLVLAIAEEIMLALQQRDPGNAMYYKANYSELQHKLVQLDAEIRDLFSNRQRDHFIVTHDSWAYFANRYGLVQLSLESFGRQKGPRGLSELVDLARTKDINTIFIQPQHPAATTDMLARELDAKLVVIDPLDGNYLDNMHTVSRRIAESLR